MHAKKLVMTPEPPNVLRCDVMTEMGAEQTWDAGGGGVAVGLHETEKASGHQRQGGCSRPKKANGALVVTEIQPVK